MDPIDSYEKNDEEDDEYHFDEDDEYDDEDSDDYKQVPVQVQEDIRKCIMDELFPDILVYMSKNGYSEFLGMKIEHVSLQILGEFYGILEPAFNKDQQYDLFSMYSIYHLFGKRGYVEREGRELVGAAMYKT